MYHKFRYSGFVKGVTAFCLGLNLTLFGYLILGQGDLWGRLVGCALLVFGVIWPFLRSPRAVRWDDERVTLYLWWGKKVFPSADYELSHVEGEQHVWAIRLFASGGYFGFWGLFWSQRIGRFRLYQTDMRSTRYLRLEHRLSGRLYYIAL